MRMTRRWRHWNAPIKSASIRRYYSGRRSTLCILTLDSRILCIELASRSEARPQERGRPIFYGATLSVFRLQFIQFREHLMTVRIWIHLKVDFPDDALRVDQESITRRHRTIARQRP